MENVVEKIIAEIQASGPISFARFMELALYCPVYGYYEREEDTVGARGDFYTSPSVGSLFGEFLAFQFADWLAVETRQEAGSGGGKHTAEGRFQLIEAGAHGGRLAGDILAWFRKMRPAVFERLQYCILEPSMRRQKWQRRNLLPFESKLRWGKDLDELASPERAAKGVSARNGGEGIRGIIFSNELLDAFPVHRLGWDALRQRWFEWGVALGDGGFVWTRMGPVPASRGGHCHEAVRAPDLPPELLAVLPEGFVLETCPAAGAWWRQAAETLRWGKLVTIDYGLANHELIVPERSNGTLRAYRNHQAGSDLLAHAGEQDLTAHVNFSEIQAIGEGAGLKTEAFLPQGQFLTGIAAKIWNAPERFGEWTPERTRQFQTLVHPEHLGRAFRVLVQSRSETA